MASLSGFGVVCLGSIACMLFLMTVVRVVLGRYIGHEEEREARMREPERYYAEPESKGTEESS